MTQFLSRSAAFLAVSAALFAQQPGTQQSGWRRFSPQGDAGSPAGLAPDTTAPDPVPQAAAAPYSQPVFSQPPSVLTVPVGTWITVRIDEVLSSDHNRMGDAFTATLTKPLIAQGYVIARAGQTIGGRVAKAEKAGTVKGQSSLGLELTELSLVDGQQVPVKSELVQNSGGTSYGRDAAAIGTTTGAGAAIGAAVNGGVGAAVGAGIGAVVSTIGVLVTRGRPTVVYPEETLTFRIVEPANIVTERAPQAFVMAQPGDYESRQPALQRRVAAPPPVPYYWGGYYPYRPFYGGFYGPGFYGPTVAIYGGGRFGGGFGRRR